MSNPQTLVQRYIEAWNETDAERRGALVEQTFTDDAIYLDPIMSGEGIVGIDQMIAAAQQQFPGHRFTLVSAPDSHHDCIRFSWSLAANGAIRWLAGSTSRRCPRTAGCSR